MLSVERYRPDGEIGRRKGLKIPRRKLRAGSIPAPGTNNHKGFRVFTEKDSGPQNRAWSAIIEWE